VYRAGRVEKTPHSSGTGRFQGAVYPTGKDYLPGIQGHAPRRRRVSFRWHRAVFSSILLKLFPAGEPKRGKKKKIIGKMTARVLRV
jgi:hypothetical protein